MSEAILGWRITIREIQTIRKVVSQGSGFSCGMVTKGEGVILVP